MLAITATLMATPTVATVELDKPQWYAIVHTPLFTNLVCQSRLSILNTMSPPSQRRVGEEQVLSLLRPAISAKTTLPDVGSIKPLPTLPKLPSLPSLPGISAISAISGGKIKKLVTTGLTITVAMEASKKVYALLERLAESGSDKAEDILEVVQAVDELKDGLLRALLGDKLADKIDGAHAAVDRLQGAKISAGRKVLSGVVSHFTG